MSGNSGTTELELGAPQYLFSTKRMFYSLLLVQSQMVLEFPQWILVATWSDADLHFGTIGGHVSEV
jgi:hypothetical protein